MQDGVAIGELGDNSLLGLAGNSVGVFITRDLQRQRVNFRCAFRVIHFKKDMARSTRVRRNQRIFYNSQFPNGARFRAKPSATGEVVWKNRALEVASCRTSKQL